METPSTPSGRRTLTPAVLLAVVFTTACALASVAFVAARGGLDLPLAMPAPSGVARASIAPTGATTGSAPPPTLAPSSAPTRTPTSSPAPSVPPTTGPTPEVTPDPLTALAPCPGGLYGCYLYTVQRGETLSTIADRWLIPIATVVTLNPQVADPRIIVVGQTLYLGRTPFVRLSECNDFSGCYRYVVRPGDRLSTIAGRYGVTIALIVAVNPGITNPNAIYSGQTIHLPGPTYPCCG